MNIFSKKVKILVFFIFLVVAFCYGVVSVLLDSQKYKLETRENIEKFFDHPVKLGHIDSKLTWKMNLRVNIDKLFIYHKDGSNFISSGPMFFEVSLPDLFFFKKVKIREIKMQKPVFFVTRLSNGHFDTEELLDSQYKVLFEDTKLIASDYKIFLTDEFLPQKKSYSIKGDRFKFFDVNSDSFLGGDIQGNIFSYGRQATHFDLQYSVEFPLNKKKPLHNNLSLKGDFKNLYLDMYLPYLRYYFPDYSSVFGTVDSKFDIKLYKNKFWSDRFKIRIHSKDIIAKKQFKGEVLRALGTLDIDVLAKRKRHDFIFDRFTIKKHDIDMSLKGRIDKIDLGNPELGLLFSIKNSSVKAVSYLCPDEVKFPYDFFMYLKKFDVDAFGSGEMEIKGTCEKPILFGYLKFKKFSLSRGIENVHDSILNMKFNGKEYNIDADVLIKPNQHVYVKGSVTPQLHNICLRVNGNNVELGPVGQVLFAIRDIFKFNLGYFVSNTIFTGKGSGDILIHDDLKNPYLDGYMDFYGSKLDYSGLSQSFDKVFGRVRFKDENIFFDNVKSTIIKSPVFVNGWIIKSKINLVFTSPRLNATEMRKLINESRDLVWTKKMIRDMKAVSGYAVAKLIFGGNVMDALKFEDFYLDILGGSITYEEVGFPIKLLSGKVLINDKGTYTNGVKAEILGSPAKIKGSILTLDSKLIPNYVVSVKRFNAEKIQSITDSTMLSKQDKEMISKLKNGRGYFDAELGFFPKEMTGHFKFYNTSFEYGAFTVPIKLLDGELFTTSKDVKFDSLRVCVENPLVCLNGKIKDYRQKPFFENFILNIPKGTNVSLLNHIFLKKGVFFDKGSLNGNVRIQGALSSLCGFLEFNDIVAGNICAPNILINIEPQGISVQDVDLSISGQRFNISAFAEKDFNLPLKINQVKVCAQKLDIDKLTESFTKMKPQGKITALPVVIENGILSFNELLLKNILVNDFSSSLCLDENGLCKLDNLRLKAFNTIANGNLECDYRNKTLAGNLSVCGAPLCSLADLLKVTPDEISGTLSCHSSFCTRGETRSEIIDNAEGVANFKVENGHCKTLGKAQYLLMAQGAVKGGVGNISLNQLLDLLFPEDLGSFKNFSATIKMKDGALVSNNLLLESKNLNISALGNVQMENKRSDIIVLGYLPQKTKKLGCFGDICPGCVLGLIPGINVLSCGMNCSGFDSFLPQVPWLLNQNVTQENKKFVIRVLKNKHPNTSHYSFEWFDKLQQNEKESLTFKK